MSKPDTFISKISTLKAEDYSALKDFKRLSNNGIELFVSGKLYNTTLESILKNYIANGENSFKTIDGDFILFIVENKKIHILRDRHGAGKQLFYSNEHISSNLLSFTNIDGFECKPNLEALFTFLSIGYIPSPLTSLENVKKLNPGYILTIDENSITDHDLFSYEDYMSKVGTSKLTIDEAALEYEKLHKKAIEDRIESVDKVGLLLSGGYDSGGNISSLRDVYKGDVVSYSIGFKNNPWTELPLAKLLSERYNSKHYEYEIDGSEIMNLPHIISTTGDPFQEGGLMVNYTAMRLVKDSGEEPQVILGGDGNDQHFGTSGKELALNWKFRKNGINLFQQFLDKAGDYVPSFDKDNILFRSEFHNRKILHIQQSDIFGFSIQKLNKMNSVGFKLNEFSYLKEHPKKFENFEDFFSQRNLNIDIKQVINEVILYKSSRMSEIFSNSMTFPYMSTELYNFLNELPVEYKFRGTLDELAKGKGQSKFLHKHYLKPKLPSEITDRKKQGGFAPLPIFLRDDKQRQTLFDFVLGSDAIKNLFDRKQIENLFKQYETIVKSKSYWFWFQQVKANQIINLLTLAVWWEMFINKKANIKTINDLL